MKTPEYFVENFIIIKGSRVALKFTSHELDIRAFTKLFQEFKAMLLLHRILKNILSPLLYKTKVSPKF